MEINKTMAEKQKLSDDDIIAKILEHKPAETEIEVKLPSLGKLYKKKKEYVKIRPMNFEDEKAIALAAEAGESQTDAILLRCVEGVTPSELLLIDELYLLFKVREISYGKNIDSVFICPNKKCGESSEVSIEINQLKVDYLEDELQEPLDLELPGIKKNCQVKFVRTPHREYFESDAAFMENLWRFVESIDGETRKDIISKIIPQLPLKDSKLIIKTILLQKYGLDRRVAFVCPACKKESTQEVPVTENFFGMS